MVEAIPLSTSFLPIGKPKTLVCPSVEPASAKAFDSEPIVYSSVFAFSGVQEPLTASHLLIPLAIPGNAKDMPIIAGIAKLIFAISTTDAEEKPFIMALIPMYMPFAFSSVTTGILKIACKPLPTNCKLLPMAAAAIAPGTINSIPKPNAAYAAPRAINPTGNPIIETNEATGFSAKVFIKGTKPADNINSDTPMAKAASEPYAMLPTDLPI